MDNIDLLYCGGCSFTRMASYNGFPELEEQWPHLLANKLNVDVINDAIWNGSNPRTFRKLEEFLRNCPIDTSKVFCLIQFTFTWRFEMPHHEEIIDYAWVESPHKEDWIRLNPGHFDLETYRTKEGSLSKCSAIHPTKENLETVYEGIDKVYGKLIRYDTVVERLDLLTHIYAMKGLLEDYGCKYKFIMGEEPLVSKVLNNDFLPGTLRTIFKDNTGSDGYHADHKGNIVIADTLYDHLMSDTDK